MFHGHQDTGGGGVDFTTGAYFFCSAIFSIFAAYYAMKFAVMRREQREAAEKRRQKLSEEVKKKGASA